MPDPNPNRDDKGRFAPKRGGGLAAVALVLALGAAGGGVAVGGAVGGAGGGTSAGRSASGTQTRARARDRSTLRTIQHLESRGLQVTQRDVHADDDCAANSYGQVQDFFQQSPCTALYRGLFEVRSARATVLVAVAWVDMPDETSARQYQQLVDRHGTGNITELSTQVPWTGEHYVSTRDGVTVVNAQAEPAGGTAAAIGLAQLAAGAAIS